MVNLIYRIAAVMLLIAVLCPLASAAAAAAEADESTVPAVTESIQQVTSHSYAVMFGVLGGLLGSGVIVFGAASGIGKIAAGATEAMARQPEAGGRIFTSMVIAASLIEGIAFFGLIVCFVAIFLIV